MPDRSSTNTVLGDAPLQPDGTLLPEGALLPEGVRDLLFADAAAWREMEAALRRTWSAWGYREIILPTFEYADTLATNVGSALDAEMYRFFDRHGRTLALRPDLTIPTARVVATRLAGQPMPLRVAYAGSVFRYEPPRAGRQHEFTQAGVELIGAGGSAADAEAIALSVAALRSLSLPGFRVSVGHIGFFRGLLDALALPPAATTRVRSAVDRKSEAELEAVLREAANLPPVVRRAVLALPRLAGDATVLDEAESFCLNSRMMAALTNLRDVSRQLAAYGVAGAVSYDLSDARDLDYYTGVTFEGFAPGIGFGLISGGRYDDLIGHFGPPLPAVGWALTLDRVLLARELQGYRRDESAADVLLSANGCGDCLAWASAARELGLRITLDLGCADPDALWQQAQATGAPRALLHREGELIALDATGERRFAGGDWAEVERWLRS